MLTIAITFVGLLGVASAGHCDSEHRGLLYPHMANNNDTELLPQNDDFFVKFKTECNYHLYGTKTNKVFIGTNGYVTTDKGQTTFIPKDMCLAPSSSKKMVAIHWSDNFPSAGEGNHIWYRESMDKELLLRARNDIKETFINPDDDCGAAAFEPKCLLIVTWQRMESYCDVFDCCYGDGRSLIGAEESLKAQQTQSRSHGENPCNYYQLVWATDNHDTYAIFNFLHLNWDNCWAHSRSGFFDYNGGDPNIKCAELPGSGTADVVDLASETNSNNDGRWIYRTDRALIKDEQCKNL